MIRYVGSIVGAGVLGSILNTNDAAPGIELFRLIFAVLLGMSALALLCATLVHRFPVQQRELQEEPAAPALAAAID